MKAQQQDQALRLHIDEEGVLLAGAALGNQSRSDGHPGHRQRVGREGGI